MPKKKKNIDTDVLIDQLLSSVSDDEKVVIDYRMGLAAKIIAGIKAKDWTRSEFARQMNVKNNSLITKWLSGYNNFETDTLIQIEKVLGIRLLDLQIPTLAPVFHISGTPVNTEARLNEAEEVLSSKWKEKIS
jgi:transcriptional regulator with XRE-family HTH domain